VSAVTVPQHYKGQLYFDSFPNLIILNVSPSPLFRAAQYRHPRQKDLLSIDDGDIVGELQFPVDSMSEVLECRLLGYKNPVHTSQETHYFSATESIRLMLCKVLGFHGRDYDECRLLGYKNPVHTSQETYYFSATESIRLMLCKILGFHGRDYDECRLLRYSNPVLTSQETIFLLCEPIRLLLCNI
jgi:hypothetical protein